LRTGALTLHDDTADGVVAYDRHDHQERWTILINFTSQPVAYAASGTITIASDAEGERRLPGVIRTRSRAIAAAVSRAAAGRPRSASVAAPPPLGRDARPPASGG
jgi:hypothetical protein